MSIIVLSETNVVNVYYSVYDVFRTVFRRRFKSAKNFELYSSTTVYCIVCCGGCWKLKLWKSYSTIVQYNNSRVIVQTENISTGSVYSTIPLLYVQYWETERFFSIESTLLGMRRVMYG